MIVNISVIVCRLGPVPVRAERHHVLTGQHMREVGQFEFTMELVEAYPCATKKELVAREQYWMDQYDWEVLLNQRRAIKK